MTKFKWVKGHSGDQGNEGANTLAGEGVRAPDFSDLDLTISEKFDLTGAQLSTLTQALAYEGIREKKEAPTRRGTIARLDITRHTVNEPFGKMPSDRTIWKAIQHKDITRSIRTFF